jgi:hypothetical protein
VRTIGALALCLLIVGGASADSIYLKNGGVIRSEWTLIEGEYVVFYQYGGKARIPLEAVERIEKDSEVAPEAVPTPSQAEYRAELVRRYAEAGLSSPVQGSEAGGGTGGVGLGAGDSRGGASSSPADTGTRDWRKLSPDTREYWQLRVAEIHDKIAVIEHEIDRLPKYNHFEEKILDGRILWVIQEKERLEEIGRGLEGDLRIVREEARKAGIPPGWLRQPPGER